MRGTSNQQEYVRRVTNPKTPEDLSLALQNPFSPAYKQMMNLLFANMMQDIVVEKLIGMYLDLEVQLKNIERAQLEKDMLREIQHQEAMSEHAGHVTGDTLFGGLNRYDAEAIKLIAQRCATDIQYLHHQLNNLNNQIKNLNKEEKENLVNWKEACQKQVQNVTDDLKREKVPLYVRDPDTQSYKAIDVTSDRGQAILEAAHKLPAPAGFVRALTDSFEEGIPMPAGAAEERAGLGESLTQTEEDLQALRPRMEDVLMRLPVNFSISKALRLCHDCVNPQQESEESHVDRFDFAGAFFEARRKNMAALKRMETTPMEVIKPYQEQYRIQMAKNLAHKFQDQYQNRLEKRQQLFDQCLKQYEQLTNKPLKLMPETERQPRQPAPGQRSKLK